MVRNLMNVKENHLHSFDCVPDLMHPLQSCSLQLLLQRLLLLFGL